MLRILNFFTVFHAMFSVLLCWPGGTKPKPEAPMTTPELSTGASGGDIGNTTGPVGV